MNKQKPVWRMNSGQGVPSDFVGKIVYRNGRISGKPQKLNATAFDFSIQGLWDDIIAYQTNRTKAAKYEHVECERCDQLIEIGAGIDGNCPHCNGKVYKLERLP